MKGKKKYIVPLLLAGVTATGVVATNVQQQQVYVQAEETSEVITQVEGAELRFKPFAQDSYTVGSKVYLPEPEVVGGVESGEKIEYKVKKGNRSVKIHTEDDATTGHEGEQYFFADYMGYYNITLSVVKDGKVTSSIDNISVWVENVEASIKLPVNSEYVIPAKIPSKQANFKIPAPSVMVEVDGEEVEKSFASEENTLSADNLKVWLVSPSAETELKEADYLDASKKFYNVPDTLIEEVGTYQIVYEYVVNNADGKETVVTRLDSNFQVVNNYDTSKVKLAMTFLSSMPSTGNVNTDISIPKVKITDTNSNSTDAINGYVEVVVTNLKDKTEQIAVDYDNFTFRPTKEGYYTVSYVAKIPLFGENCKTSPVTPGDIIEVKDKQAPTIIPTYKYEFDTVGEISKVHVGDRVEDIVKTDEKSAREIAEELLVNRKVDVPSVAVLKNVTKDENGKTVTSKEAKVTIPAAYAFDNFYTYKGSINDDITITRTYRTSTGVVHKVDTAANLPAEITFTTKGNSEIRYKATDKANNTLGEIVYDIVVYDGTDTTVQEKLNSAKTKINLNVGTDVVSDKEKTLTFAKPTATDTYDKNIEVKTFVRAGGTTTELTETNDDGEYEILIDKYSQYDSFEIYAEAYLDEALKNTRGNDPEKHQLVDTNKITSEITTVKVIHASQDLDAPEFSMAESKTWNEALYDDNETEIADALGEKIDSEGYLVKGDGVTRLPITDEVDMAPFDQNKTIKLPDVKFSDNYDKNVTITVSIKDKFGNEVSKVDQEKVYIVDEDTTPYEYYIEGATFKLSTYGVYTVTFTAQDIAGNITVKTFGIRVNDKTKPTIVIDDEDKFGKEIEVGEYFKVPTQRLFKDGKEVEAKIRKWEIYKVSDGAKYSEGPNGFTPLTEGTFFIRYEATDIYGQSADLEDSMFTVTAKDTQAPVIELDKTYRMKTTIKWDPQGDDNFVVVDVPMAFATDKLTEKDIEVDCEVTGPNGFKATPEDYEDETLGYKRKFKATAQGVYTVKYHAADDAGNEKTQTYTIEVGDCKAPELTWVNEEKDLPTEVKLGTPYVLDLNSIKLADYEGTTTEDELLEDLKVTMTGPGQSTVTTKINSNNQYEWNFDKAGEYTLKFTATDKVGNKKDYTYTINVPAEEVEENKVSPVLGTVLVVLSVVVLSGVVIYFVASSKKKNAKSTSKKSK